MQREPVPGGPQESARALKVEHHRLSTLHDQLVAQLRELGLSWDGEAECSGCTLQERADRDNKGERGQTKSSAAAGESGFRISFPESRPEGGGARVQIPCSLARAPPIHAHARPPNGTGANALGAAKLLRQPPPPERRGGRFLEAPDFPRPRGRPFFCVPQLRRGSCLGGSGGWREAGLEWVRGKAGKPAPGASCSYRLLGEPDRPSSGLVRAGDRISLSCLGASLNC